MKTLFERMSEVQRERATPPPQDEVTVMERDSNGKPFDPEKVERAAMLLVDLHPLLDHHSAVRIVKEAGKEYRQRALLTRLSAQLKAAHEALDRLGGMEAFVTTRAIKKGQDDELIARIDFARAALKAQEDQPR